jgi:hypothetical protein
VAFSPRLLPTAARVIDSEISVRGGGGRGSGASSRTRAAFLARGSPDCANHACVQCSCVRGVCVREVCVHACMSACMPP